MISLVRIEVTSLMVLVYHERVIAFTAYLSQARASAPLVEVLDGILEGLLLGRPVAELAARAAELEVAAVVERKVPARQLDAAVRALARGDGHPLHPGDELVTQVAQDDAVGEQPLAEHHVGVADDGGLVLELDDVGLHLTSSNFWFWGQSCQPSSSSKKYPGWSVGTVPPDRIRWVMRQARQPCPGILTSPYGLSWNCMLPRSISSSRASTASGYRRLNWSAVIFLNWTGMVVTSRSPGGSWCWGRACRTSPGSRRPRRRRSSARTRGRWGSGRRTSCPSPVPGAASRRPLRRGSRSTPSW